MSEHDNERGNLLTRPIKEVPGDDDFTYLHDMDVPAGQRSKRTPIRSAAGYHVGTEEGQVPVRGEGGTLTSRGQEVVTYGLTESATRDVYATVTIPIGMSTIKLPPSVWDGQSNVGVFGFAFSGGNPEVGYEFNVVAPKTEDPNNLIAGTLGNYVRFAHGDKIKCEATGGWDYFAYPNATDNPDSEPVQFAALYERLTFRVDDYDGDDPICSLIKLPDPISGQNDNGVWKREANGVQWCCPTAGRNNNNGFPFPGGQLAAGGHDDISSQPWPVVFASEFREQSVSYTSWASALSSVMWLRVGGASGGAGLTSRFYWSCRVMNTHATTGITPRVAVQCTDRWKLL